MERFISLLLEVWREACRHIELRGIAGPERGRSCGAACRWMRSGSGASISRAASVETAAIARVAGAGESPAPGAERARAARSASGCSPGAGEARSPHASGRARCEDGCPALLGSGTRGRRAGRAARRRGRAARGRGAAGRAPPRVFRAEHAELLAALLEPFAVALENDRRLREMKTLREAAEADRLSLLARLGRKELAETHRRDRRRAASGDGARRARGAPRRAGADPRRDGLRQGGGGARDPHALAARGRPRSSA